ncbi:MAG TPA: prepilin-type N-terminal cleavage/methylation domain-containing protein, partial [Xanthomonadaceae bacterium]|nr:prepilin-type N-terminal cleavage/methylation domain-containing protein [Xanthomonadaceae bacterium]
MNRIPSNSRQRQGGFSIVEAMVALVAGLIVIGAVLAFTVATVQSNTENVQATRLAQELRALMNLVARDVRRAGYDDLSLERVGTGTDGPADLSPHARMQIVGGD